MKSAITKSLLILGTVMTLVGTPVSSWATIYEWNIGAISEGDYIDNVQSSQPNPVYSYRGSGLSSWYIHWGEPSAPWPDYSNFFYAGDGFGARLWSYLAASSQPQGMVAFAWTGWGNWGSPMVPGTGIDSFDVNLRGWLWIYIYDLSGGQFVGEQDVDVAIPPFTVKVQETPNGFTLVPPDTWASMYLDIRGTKYSLTPFDLSGDLIMAPVPVPEPSTLLLLGTGLIGLAGYGRKKFFKK